MKRQLVLGNLTATVADDARLGLLVLIAGRVVDDLATAAADVPHPGPVEVIARLRGVDPTGPGESARFSITAKPGGLFAVSAARDWALSQLTAAARVIDLTIGAPGFLSVTRSVAIPTGFTAFPLTVPNVALRRPAVRIRGRLMSAGAGSAPLPNRTIAVTAPARLTGFHTTTLWSHTSGTTITPLTVTPQGSDLQLQRDVWPGDTVLILGRRTDLAVDRLIRLGTAPDDELVRVASLTGPATLDDAGTAVLATPVTRVHQAGAATLHVDIAASGPVATTTVDTDAAALITIVDHPERLPDGQPCRFDDPDPARVEYGSTHAPSATTDAAGYFSTGPVGAARTVSMTVTPPGATVSHVLSFDQPDNVVNLTV